MSLAERLKTTRKKLGLSQSALAKSAGVTQPTVANWERGGHAPRPDALRRIATALNADPSWLLTGELPAPLNPAHLHLAKPIHHIPVYEWPQSESLLDAQPAAYLSVAADAEGLFALRASGQKAFPAGTILIFRRGHLQDPGTFLVKSDETYTLTESPASLDDVFARLVYSVMRH